MNICNALFALPLLLPATALWAQEEDVTLKVQGWSFSDPELTTAKGEPCAEFITFLTGPYEKYRLLGMAGVAGPPGVVYTLQNNSGETAIVKCGTAGGHTDGGGCEE